MALQAWFGVSAASREGARVGDSVGPTADADCRILEAVAAALQSTSGDEVKQVTVVDHDPSTGTDGVSTPIARLDPASDDPINLVCPFWFTMGDRAGTRPVATTKAPTATGSVGRSSSPRTGSPTSSGGRDRSTTSSGQPVES